MASEMVFTMGLPAAGKSTTVAARYATTHTVIDPDMIKESHPDYNPKAPEALREWSSEIAEQMFAAAIAAGVGAFVVDGTGTNAEKMARRIKEARAAGFAVSLRNVRGTSESSPRRNAKRARTVPESVIREKARDIATSFEIVASYVGAASVEVVEND